MKYNLALLITLLLAPLSALYGSDRALAEFKPLVYTESWTEKWPTVSGAEEARNVTAEVWTGCTDHKPATASAQPCERNLLHRQKSATAAAAWIAMLVRCQPHGAPKP